MDNERIRRDVARLQEARKNNIGMETEGTWGSYAANTSEYLSELEVFFPGMAAKLIDQIQEWKEKGITVGVVDIAGMADGHDIGGNFTVNIALLDPENRSAEDPERTVVLADITTPGGQKKALDAIDALPHQPRVYFFLPVAGIAPGFGYNEVVGVQLARFFKEIYARLPEEAHVYISTMLWDRMYAQRFELFLREERIAHEAHVAAGAFHIQKPASKE